MATCLVFGGTQFVGKAMAKRLIREGHEVYVLNRGTREAPQGSKALIVDRNNINELSAVLYSKTFDYVYDISAYTPEQTRNAIQLLKGKTKHFIHISSASVYLATDDYPLDETSKTGINPIWGDYGANKYLCEQELMKEYTQSKFPCTIVRPFYIYGPGNNLDRETYIFKRLLNNSPIIIPGKGENVIQFGHIDDLGETLIRMSGNSKSFGQIYNVGDGSSISLEGWVKTCAQIIGVEPSIVLVDAKETGYLSREWFPFRDVSLYGSTEKLLNDFGANQKFSLFEGLKQTFTHLSKEELIDSYTMSNVEKDILERRGYSINVR